MPWAVLTAQDCGSPFFLTTPTARAGGRADAEKRPFGSFTCGEACGELKEYLTRFSGMFFDEVPSNRSAPQCFPCYDPRSSFLEKGRAGFLEPSFPCVDPFTPESVFATFNSIRKYRPSQLRGFANLDYGLQALPPPAVAISPGESRVAERVSTPANRSETQQSHNCERCCSPPPSLRSSR